MAGSRVTTSTAGYGRIARGQESPREGPECVPKPPYEAVPTIRKDALPAGLASRSPIRRSAFPCWGWVGR